MEWKEAYSSVSSVTVPSAPSFSTSLPLARPVDDVGRPTTQVTPSAMHRWHSSMSGLLIHLSFRFLHCLLNPAWSGHV